MNIDDYVADRLHPRTWYKHCCGCGEIYDWDKTKVIMNTLDVTNVTWLDEPFKNYNISSGYCKPCLKERFPKSYYKMFPGEKE